MLIYIAKNKTQTGPFSEEQLNGMMTGGLVSPSDLAWHDGLSDWQPLHSVLGLRQPPPIPATPPPFATPPAIVTQSAGPIGVGGWLTFFCVGLTILGPLSAVVSMISTLQQCKPAFDKFPALSALVYWENFGCTVLLIYGFIVGCIVWSGNPKGRSIARQYLVINWLGFIGMEFIALQLMEGIPTEMVSAASSEVVLGILKTSIGFMVWWTYFKRSKRVKNTYGYEPA